METESLSDMKIGTERYRSGRMETWYYLQQNKCIQNANHSTICQKYAINKLKHVITS